MKVRLGFVSNSSAASYIITLGGNIKDINKLIIESVQFVSWNNELKENIKYNIARTEKTITDLECGKEHFLISSVEEQQYQLQQLKADLEYLGDSEHFLHSDCLEYATIVLRHYYITRTDMYNGDVKLSYFTSMHNCYTEGMPQILHELILYHAFEKTDVKLTCEIDKNSDN